MWQTARRPDRNVNRLVSTTILRWQKNYCTHLEYYNLYSIKVSMDRLGGKYSNCTYVTSNPSINVFEEYYNVKYSSAVSFNLTLLTIGDSETLRNWHCDIWLELVIFKLCNFSLSKQKRPISKIHCTKRDEQ